MYEANYKVKPEDKIEIELPEARPAENVQAENINLDIVYEDKDLVVVNKPSGMVVHPATGNFKGTLVNALLYKYKELEFVGERIRSGLINRIDKDTSGLVLVGKTNKALWHYSKQFADREVSKVYLAVVKGDFHRAMKDQESIRIVTYIDRNPRSRTKYATASKGKGRIAISNFSLIALSKDEKFSFLKVKIETGRTHQIRVHLHELGFPVVGDSVYSGPKYKRLLLHSYQIKLKSPEQKTLRISADVDGDFALFLRQNFDLKDIAKYTKSKK
jgi:23S rRNA pseudouridine1911/1915/1917 synthase